MQTTISQVQNGVNVSDLFKTIQAVQQQPEIAKFRFRISNRWVNGAHNRSSVKDFRGAMQDLQHQPEFTLEAGEPPLLLGNDEGANPVEILLHALAACVTTSTVYHAAAQGIAIETVSSEIEGELDLRGFLGLDPDVRNGYQRIKMTLRIQADATEQEWEKLAAFGPRFSPVYDSVTRGVPVEFVTERV